jgi:hypothetical protein
VLLPAAVAKLLVADDERVTIFKLTAGRFGGGDSGGECVRSATIVDAVPDSRSSTVNFVSTVIISYD